MATIALTTPEQIDMARLFTLRAALRMEAAGMKRRGRSALAICKSEGLVNARTAREALVQINELIGSLSPKV